jgi:hypothetical protein
MNPEWYVTYLRRLLPPPVPRDADTTTIWSVANGHHRVSSALLFEGLLLRRPRYKAFPADGSSNADTTTSSSCSSSVTLVSESHACCSDSPMIHTQRATSLLSVLTSYVCLKNHCLSARSQLMPTQKIRTIELDGKTVKLQIVRIHLVHLSRCEYSLGCVVGYRRPRALPNHYLILLPRRPRHLRRLRCHRHGFIQQRKAVAARDRPICDRGCQ